MLLVDIISGRSSTSSTLKYTIIVPGYRDIVNICMYLHSSSNIVVHLWRRLSVVQVVRYSAFEIA